MAISIVMNEIDGKLHRQTQEVPFATKYIRVYQVPAAMTHASSNQLRGQAMIDVSNSEITNVKDWIDNNGRAAGIEVTAQVVRAWSDGG